jgi:NAD(P) transhydrogenase
MTSSEALQRDFDLIILGSGPAGIHAAIQAAKIHKRVCIVESNPLHIGGSWIHTGTLPSKTLREGLAAIHGLQEHVGKHWVHRLIHDLHTGRLFQHALEVSEQEEGTLRDYIRNNHIQIMQGFASLESPFSVRVNAHKESKVLSSEFILIATGSRPDRPVNIPFDGWRVIDSDDVFNLETIPQSMVIYGAGVIGCEYACIFASMGVEVTLIDGRTQILQYCDQEIIRELQTYMEAMGIKFKLGTRISHLHVQGPHVSVVFGDEQVPCDVMLWAGRRLPMTEHIGLEKLGIGVDKYRSIVVNENFQTPVSNIYAAGDVVGIPSLAATASQQGRFIACHAFGMTLGSFPKDYPIGIYTIPECSMVGKTEEALIREGHEYVVGRAMYKEVARSMIAGQTQGLLKLLIDAKTHVILGVHIVGDDACNLVHIGLAFMTKNGHAQDFINMVFNYPTLAEAYRIAAFNGLNKLFPDGVIKPPPFERRRNVYSSIK